MKKEFITFFAFIFLTVGAFSQDFVRTNMADSRETIHLNSMQVLELNLPSNPSTGYGWYVKDKSRLTLLRQTGSETFESDDKENPVGTPGTTTIRFVPTGQGSCDLEMVYLRPFENSVPEATYKVKVHCEGKYNGNYLPQEKTEEVKVKQNDETADDRNLPASFSWQSKCTSVKNQGSCGSCWSFTATAVFEAVLNIWENVQKDFSEQYLVNCHTGSKGCDGGTYDGFSLYISKGAVMESALPYKAKNGTCATYTHNEKAIAYKTVANNTTTLKQALYDYGPVFTAICAGDNLQNYKSGTLTKSDGTSVNHAVTLVGWDDVGGYWIVKNSWGATWGDKGYFKIKYGVSGIGESSAYLNYKGKISHGPTGIADVADLSLSLSPNPSEGRFTVNGLKETNKIEVYDVVGRTVHTSTVTTGSYVLDLSAQNKGIYLYRVTNIQTNKVAQGRLIVN